jgi:hypothetical protein
MGLSYRTARLHRFAESIPRLLKSLKIPFQNLFLVSGLEPKPRPLSRTFKGIRIEINKSYIFTKLEQFSFPKAIFVSKNQQNLHTDVNVLQNILHKNEHGTYFEDFPALKKDHDHGPEFKQIHRTTLCREL